MTKKKFRVTDYPLISMLMVVRKTQENIVARAPAKITIPQWRILGALGEENWIAMTKLSDRTYVERTSLYHILNNMEVSGNVRRRKAAADKRSIEVSLTPKGKRLYQQCAVIAQEEIEQTLGGIPKSELRPLLKTLDKMKDNLGIPDW